MPIHKKITIGNIEVFPPLALAPMVGLSHSALRSLIAEQGGAGLFFTEMLSAKRLPDENVSKSPCLIKSPSEYPLFYQLFFADEPSVILPAIRKLEHIGAQGVDLNLGCPAPQLRKIGAGCFLTNNHSVVKKLIALFRKNTELPLTVKIRLGKELNEKVFLELCSMFEGEGVDCITIHARLQGEKFCRKPRWAWIGKVKNRVNIPVIANGGIYSVEDARICLEISGADGLMIGRGAVWKPWIFSEISNTLYNKNGLRTEPSLQNIYFRFIELLKQRFTSERRLGRLKQFTHYFSKSYVFGHKFATDIQSSVTMEQAIIRAESFFENNASTTE